MLSFSGRNPRDSLLAEEGSAGLRSHERLSDQETVKTGRHSCVPTELNLLGYWEHKTCLIGGTVVGCAFGRETSKLWTFYIGHNKFDISLN